MARALGPKKAQGLPMFHALTGCDTVFCFAGRGKRKAWAVWTALTELTQVLIDLTTAPAQVDEDATQTIERFVILLYDRTSTSTDVNKACCKLFARMNNVQLRPPTSVALKQHVRRAGMSGARLCFLHQHCPTRPTAGWVKTSEQTYEPHWTTLPEASKVCRELVSCKCQKGCTKKCKCKKAKLECTQLCACDRECSQN